MDKHEIIQKLFTLEEQKEIIPVLPDQWAKRNRNLIKRCVEERYILHKDGDVIDLYNQLWISARYMHGQLKKLVEISSEECDNEEKLKKLLVVLFEVENQMPL